MTRILPKPVQYVPYHEIGERPHIIVDGAPLPSTALTLSHWPSNQTHPSLRRDTSTATVFAYLDAPEYHQDIPVVSNNHFDEDGLFSMFGLVDPQLALEYRDLLTGGALAGDFGVGNVATAVRLCFIVESFCNPVESPLPAATFDGCERRRVTALYQSMLERLPTLVRDIDAWESLWRDQYEHFEASTEWLENGTVTIEEYPDVDLAVVSIPGDLRPRAVRRYLNEEKASVHPFAIHNKTSCNRILRVTGGTYDLQYRYESWVQLVTRRPMLRVSLDDLVSELNRIEHAAGEWVCDDVTDVSPRLYLVGVDRSTLAPEQFVDQVRRHLAVASVAWDPYDWDSAA